MLGAARMRAAVMGAEGVAVGVEAVAVVVVLVLIVVLGAVRDGASGCRLCDLCEVCEVRGGRPALLVIVRAAIGRAAVDAGRIRAIVVAAGTAASGLIVVR